MASLKPSSSETCRKGGRRSMRGVEVLAAIFHDSDSAEEFDSGLSLINPDLLYTLPEAPGPVDFFHIFIHDEIVHVDILVHETNRYAEQYITSATLSPESE